MSALFGCSCLKLFLHSVRRYFCNQSNSNIGPHTAANTFYVFSAQGMCLVAESVVFPSGRASKAPPNPLAGFDRPLRGTEGEGKGKEAQIRKGHSRNKYLVITALATTLHAYHVSVTDGDSDAL